MNPGDIPKEHLITYARDRVANICARPAMYGGSWQGAEVALLCAYDLLDFAESWPEPQSHKAGPRWFGAVRLATHKGFDVGNTSLAGALEHEGVTDYMGLCPYHAAAPAAYASATQKGNKLVLSHEDATRIENAVRTADQHVQRVRSILGTPVEHSSVLSPASWCQAEAPFSLGDKCEHRAGHDGLHCYNGKEWGP